MITFLCYHIFGHQSSMNSASDLYETDTSVQSAPEGNGLVIPDGTNYMLDFFAFIHYVNTADRNRIR